MSSLIRPFKEGRPISATIRVDRETIRDSGRVSRVFAKVARNSAGDVWTLRYAHGLPVGVTLLDARRRLFLVYHPGETAPRVTSAETDLAAVPVNFPLNPPDESPAFLSGIPCFRRKWASEHEGKEVWYSYDYAVYARTVNRLAGYGLTTWYLDDVKLAEPPAEVFSDSSISGTDAEYRLNLWKVAAEVFAKADGSGG